jgi:hypothetical protein
MPVAAGTAFPVTIPNTSTTVAAPRGILLPRADAARDAPINGAGLHAFAAPAGHGMKSGMKTKFRSRDARLFTPQRQLTCAAGKLILLFRETVFSTSSSRSAPRFPTPCRKIRGRSKRHKHPIAEGALPRRIRGDICPPGVRRLRTA